MGGSTRGLCTTGLSSMIRVVRLTRFSDSFTGLPSRGFRKKESILFLVTIGPLQRQGWAPHFGHGSMLPSNRHVSHQLDDKITKHATVFMNAIPTKFTVQPKCH